MPITISLVLLEFYFNQHLESFKSDHKLASYGQNTKTGDELKSHLFLVYFSVLFPSKNE